MKSIFVHLCNMANSEQFIKDHDDLEFTDDCLKVREKFTNVCLCFSLITLSLNSLQIFKVILIVLNLES